MQLELFPGNNFASIYLLPFCIGLGPMDYLKFRKALDVHHDPKKEAISSLVTMRMRRHYHHFSIKPIKVNAKIIVDQPLNLIETHSEKLFLLMNENKTLSVSSLSSPVFFDFFVILAYIFPIRSIHYAYIEVQHTQYTMGHS